MGITLDTLDYDDTEILFRLAGGNQEDENKRIDGENTPKSTAANVVAGASAVRFANNLRNLFMKTETDPDRLIIGRIRRNRCNMMSR